MNGQHWIFRTTPDTDFNNLERSNFQLFKPGEKTARLEAFLFEHISSPVLLIDHDAWSFPPPVNTIDKLTELFKLIIQAAKKFITVGQILIDSSIDPVNYRLLLEKLNEVAQQLNVDKIVLLGGFSDITNQHAAVVPGSFWYFRAYSLITCEHSNNGIDTLHHREREFSCLNRTPKDHRLLLYSMLKDQGLLHSFIYSFYDRWPYFSDKSLMDSTTQIPAIIIPEKSTQWKTALDNIVDFPISWLDQTAGINDHTINHPAYHEAYCNVVTESSMIDEFVSEKIWKPIAAGQLFLVIGSQHTCRWLEELGFYTFEKELYDDEPDHVKRIQKVVDIVANKRSNVRQWWLDNLDKIQHNRDRFYSKEFNSMMIASIAKHFSSTKYSYDKIFGPR